MDNEKKKRIDEESVLENEHNDFNYEVILDQLQKKFDLEEKKLNNIIEDQEKNIIYLKSDIENIKRNSLKEVQSNVNRKISNVISLFLLVFDDYLRSVDYAKTYNNQELLNGLLITYNSFLKVLKDLEVEQIDTNGDFDPKLHEAISMISDDTKISNSIAQVIQIGFLYKNQVLRPAKVIIFS